MNCTVGWISSPKLTGFSRIPHFLCKCPWLTNNWGKCLHCIVCILFLVKVTLTLDSPCLIQQQSRFITVKISSAQLVIILAHWNCLTTTSIVVPVWLPHLQSKVPTLLYCVTCYKFLMKAMWIMSENKATFPRNNKQYGASIMTNKQTLTIQESTSTC